MAQVPAITVPINFEITNTSKQALKPLVAETISEALEGSKTIIKGEDELRAFIRAEVRKALADVMHEAQTQMGGRF